MGVSRVHRTVAAGLFALCVAILLSVGLDGADLAGQTAGKPRSFSYPRATLDLTCTEVAGLYAVDAAEARSVVPEPYTVKINPDGSATLGLMVQECRNVVMNRYVSSGPAGFVHAWIAIEGPVEIDPVPGTVETLPTMHWYSFRDQTSNRLLAAGMLLHGANVEMVSKVSLGGVTAGLRTGSVIEKRRSGAGYSWQEASQALPAVPIGVNHRFYRQEAGPFGGELVEGRVRCAIQLYGQGQASLLADPSSVIADMGFGTPIYGNTLDLTMGCKMTVQVRVTP